MSVLLNALGTCDICAHPQPMKFTTGGGAATPEAARVYLAKYHAWDVIEVDGKKLDVCARCAARRKAVA